MNKKKEWEAAIREQRVTYDIYAELPEDGNREVLDGALELMSGPSLVHQMLGGNLYYITTHSCSSDFLFYLRRLMSS